jgi:hypothetical protein
MADVLAGTLYLTGSLTTSDSDPGGTGAGSSQILTAAGSHDGSDATDQSFLAFDDQGNLLNAWGETIVMGAVTQVAVSTVSFVRVKIRARGTQFGPGSTNGEVQFYYNGTSLPVTANIGQTGAFNDYQADIALNPNTGLAWSAASDFLTSTIGFRIIARSFDITFSSGVQVDVSEFSIELWSPAATEKVYALPITLDKNTTIKPVHAVAMSSNPVSVQFSIQETP